jgi:cytochrome c oxidase accessory protein FixG
MTQSPLLHPTGALVVFGTSALVFFDFAYFREQMCTVVCPYARLQSALLDQRSLVVGYDRRRGEPRGGGRRQGGDCVDCKACVVACPTGIDIRDGLQLECISCTQCVDACNSVMRKLDKAPGLVRYASSQWFETGKTTSWLRPRIVIYVVLLGGVIAALISFGRERAAPAEVAVLRGIGAPFVEQGELVRNQLRVKVRNRTELPKGYRIALVGAGASSLIAPENPLQVAAGDQATTTIFIVSPRSVFTAGSRAIEITVSSDDGFEQHIGHHLLGP